MTNIFMMQSNKFNDEVIVKDYQLSTNIGLYDFEEAYLKFIHFDESQVSTVLIPGCGTGREALKFARNGSKVTCIDISINMLKQAEENFLEEELKGHFLLSNCLDLSNEIPNKYNLIFASNNFLEHIPFRFNRLKILKNFSNLMSEDGSLILCVHNRDKTSEKHQSFWNQNIIDVKSGKEIHNYKLEHGDKFLSRITPNDNSSDELFMHIYSLEEIIEDLKNCNFIIKNHMSVFDIHQKLLNNKEKIENYKHDVVFIHAKKGDIEK